MEMRPHKKFSSIMHTNVMMDHIKLSQHILRAEILFKGNAKTPRLKFKSMRRDCCLNVLQTSKNNA